MDILEILICCFYENLVFFKLSYYLHSFWNICLVSITHFVFLLDSTIAKHFEQRIYLIDMNINFFIHIGT